jgi:hypothetical protein
MGKGDGEMPKETVQYPSTDGPSGTEISVGWSKDNYVQLHVQRHVWTNTPAALPVVTDAEKVTAATAGLAPLNPYAAQRLADHVAGVETCDCQHRPCDHSTPEEPQEAIVGQVEYVGIGPDPISGYEEPQEVWTEVLSRAEINKLIRVLRRARDQAYGRDE